MTFHTTSDRRPATGGQTPGGADQPTSPRIAVSFPPDDFNRLAQLAHQQAVPIAALIRRAIQRMIQQQQAKEKDMTIITDEQIKLIAEAAVHDYVRTPEGKAEAEAERLLAAQAEARMRAYVRSGRFDEDVARFAPTTRGTP